MKIIQLEVVNLLVTNELLDFEDIAYGYVLFFKVLLNGGRIRMLTDDTNLKNILPAPNIFPGLRLSAS